MRRVVIAVLLAACGGSDAGQRIAVQGSAEAEKVAEERAATLLVLDSLTEEGISQSAVPTPSAPGPHFRDGRLYADERALRALFRGARADEGAETDPTGHSHGDATYVPVAEYAARRGAYLHISPDGSVASLWPRELLCAYARRADPAAAVFQGAAAEGLLERCTPPIHVSIRRWTDLPDSARWVAAVGFDRRISDSEVRRLAERNVVQPFAFYLRAAALSTTYRVPRDSAGLQRLAEARTAAINAVEESLCGFPAANARRSGARVGSAEQRASFDRALLSGVETIWRDLPRLRIGAPIVYGLEVSGQVRHLRRLANDPLVSSFIPAVEVNRQRILSPPSLPEEAEGPARLRDIEALSPAEVRARLTDAARFAERECRATRAAAEAAN